MIYLIFAVICLISVVVFASKANKAVDSNNAYNAVKYGSLAGCFSALVGSNIAALIVSLI